MLTHYIPWQQELTHCSKSVRTSSQRFSWGQLLKSRLRGCLQISAGNFWICSDCDGWLDVWDSVFVNPKSKCWNVLGLKAFKKGPRCKSIHRPSFNSSSIVVPESIGFLESIGSTATAELGEAQ